MDKKDKLKTRIRILPDNDINDIYFYELIIHTGKRINAGTESNVKLKLLGDCFESRITHINQKEQSFKYGMKCFQRGSIDSFILSSAE